MSADGLPATAEPPISEDVRQCEIEILQGLLANGQVDLERFQQALDALIAAQTEADLVSVVRSLPPPVPLVSPSRRRREPLEITTSMGEVRLDGRWQVSRLTKVRTGMGSVTIDLTEAEFDDWDVEIVVHAHMGEIIIIVPRGFDVRPEGQNGPIQSSVGPPIPGFPIVRVSATTDMGTIRIMHPKEQAQRSRRRRRQR